MRISIQNRKVKCGILITLIFIYVFNPPLIPLNMHIIVEGIAVIYLIWYMLKKHGCILINRKLLSIAGAFLPFLIYEIVMTVIHTTSAVGNVSAYTSEFLLVIRIFVRLFIVCSAYYFFTIDNKISSDDQYEIFMIVAIIQLFFVFLSLVVPTVRTTIMNMIINNSSDSNIVSAVNRLSARRGYGLAENLFDSFGYILSILIAIIYLSWLEKGGLKKIVVSILLMVACVLNARTGVLLGILVIVISSFIYKKSNGQIKYFLMAVICFPFIFFVFMKLMQTLMPSTLAWILEGYIEVMTLLQGGKYIGTFEILLQSNIFFPGDILLGAGGSPENLSKISLDVGYVQCVWRYGIIGTTLLIGGYLINLFRFFGSGNRKYKILVIVIAILFIIYLFKIFSINNIGAHFLVLAVIMGGVADERTT